MALAPPQEARSSPFPLLSSDEALGPISSPRTWVPNTSRHSGKIRRWGRKRDFLGVTFQARWDLDPQPWMPPCCWGKR